jgi:hypothetical protein
MLVGPVCSVGDPWWRSGYFAGRFILGVSPTPSPAVRIYLSMEQQNNYNNQGRIRRGP